MAAKKKTLPQASLPSSSSEESESDEEPQVPQVTQKPTIASTGKIATKQPLPPPSASSEEESDDETEEETESSEPDVPVPTKKEQTLTRKEPTLTQKEQPSTQKEPISTRKEIASTPKGKGTSLPNEEASESESESESEEEELPPKTAPIISKKRNSVMEKEKEPASVASSTGRKLFQRIWTEEDEVTLIKMLVKYKKMHGKLPSSPTENGVFHELVRNALHVHFTRIQLLNKIRSVKLKYYSNQAKTDNGKNNPQKDHDKLCFELSRKVWGDADLKKVEKDDDAADNRGKDVTKNGTAKKRKTKTSLVTPQHEASLEEGRGVHSEILVSSLDEMSMVFPSISKVSYKHLNKAIGNLEAEEVRSFENELRLLNVNQLLLTNKRHAFLTKLLSAITSKLGFPTSDSTC